MKELQSMDTTVGRIVQLITEASDSPVQDLIHREPPKSDFGYLKLWFDYIEYTHIDRDHFHELVHDGWLAYEDIEDSFPLRLEVWRRVSGIIERAFSRIRERMAFTPRLERYVSTYEESEQTSVRLLLIGYLNAVRKNGIRNDLTDLAQQYPEIQQYIYNLNDHHRLFTEKVIEFESSRFDEDKALIHKDFLLCAAMFKLFGGLEMTEEELIMLHDSPVVELFGLDLPDAMRDEPSRQGLVQESVSASFLDGDADDELEDTSIEDLIRLMRERESEDDLEEDELDDDDLEFEEESDEEPETELTDEGQAGELTAYADDLEYLYGAYQWIEALVEIKEINSNDYLDRDDRHNLTLFRQKAKRQQRISEVRLQKSIESGFKPRLEVFSSLLRLDEKEKRILVILLVEKVFGLKRTSYGSMDVNDILYILYDNAMDRVKAKRYFMKHAKLVKSNMIQLDNNRLSDDIMQCSIQMDNRLLEYFIGEDYDISNYVEGSVLTTSSIPLEHVILPEDSKRSLLTMIDHFPTFLDVKKKFDFSSVVQYGDALVLLFVGPSGTGKTMLANALGNYLKKNLLLINVNNRMDNSFSSYTDDNILAVLFREARMHDALLFFDEAEDMLNVRMNSLLTEIEKHRGIVIFATNVSFSIDEALRRRINYIYHFKEPGPALRKRIWELHLPASVHLDADVDLNLLAKRFEINGGLIKNAVFSALAKAAGEAEGPPKLRMRHLVEGAKEQLRNKLYMSDLVEPVSPALGLDAVVLPEKTIEALEEILNIEKSRKVLTGEWGFDELFPDHNGVAVLFHGPPGTGKTRTAEAIAYETGKKLKVVNYAQVVSMWVGGTEKALEALFAEADEDTILLFDEADALFSHRVNVSSANDRFVNTETDVLLRLIERCNTMAILTTNVFEQIDPAFMRRIPYILEFKRPDVVLREKLWEQLIPDKLPLAEDIDLGRLAREFDFTGGDIKNAIFRAAARLATRFEKDTKLSTSALEAACREIGGSRNKKDRPIGFTKN